MTRFVALLRGVNVGGNNRVPMADLRVALEADGLSGARTYIQSGNVVVDARTSKADVLAARVRAVISRTFDLDVRVIALTADELEAAAGANPFSREKDPKRVHAIFLPHPPDKATIDAIAERQDKANAKGSHDVVVTVGRVAYLHTPDGFGVSELAKALSSGRTNPLADGTARNWSTVTTLLAMCHETDN